VLDLGPMGGQVHNDYSERKHKRRKRMNIFYVIGVVVVVLAVFGYLRLG
jgi:hypothetical protein